MFSSNNFLTMSIRLLLCTDDESLALVLSGEETEVENIVVARLGEFQGANLCTRSIKKPTIPVQKVIIFAFF